MSLISVGAPLARGRIQIRQAGNGVARAGDPHFGLGILLVALAAAAVLVRIAVYGF